MYLLIIVRSKQVLASAASVSITTDAASMHKIKRVIPCHNALILSGIRCHMCLVYGKKNHCNSTSLIIIHSNINIL